MDCQLMGLAPAGVKLPLPERLYASFRARLREARSRAARLLASLRAGAGRPAPRAASSAAAPGSERHRLRLVPGELVRVRSLEEILSTLDHRGRCQGLPFMSPVMNDFCGGTFTVKKRVDRFFDESRWRSLRLKDVVILEGVHCEPPPDIGEDWAGCKRTCFLFWKEAWLERAADSGPPAGDR
jgi:hypothetical protein